MKGKKVQNPKVKVGLGLFSVCIPLALASYFFAADFGSDQWIWIAFLVAGLGGVSLAVFAQQTEKKKQYREWIPDSRFGRSVYRSVLLIVSGSFTLAAAYFVIGSLVLFVSEGRFILNAVWMGIAAIYLARLFFMKFRRLYVEPDAAHNRSPAARSRVS
jgi:hypothetical protein